MKWLTILLVPLVILSLLLNWLMLWQWQNVRVALQGALDEAIASLSDLREERIEYNLAVDQQIPFQADLLLEEPLMVPISTTFDTEVAVRWQGIEMPIQVAIPINLQMPLETQVPVDIDHVPVSTTVALQTELPIVIEISETPLADYLSRLQQELVLLRAGL